MRIHSTALNLKKMFFTRYHGYFQRFPAALSTYNIVFTRWTMIGYGSLGALIFSLYLVYDTQLMLGGKHKYSLRY
jgi:hypothetical protein